MPSIKEGEKMENQDQSQEQKQTQENKLLSPIYIKNTNANNKAGILNQARRRPHSG